MGFRTGLAGLAALAVMSSACATGAPDDAQPGHMAEAQGVPVHVREWGEGPDVLMIHGAASSMGEFEVSLVPVLRDEFHLTAFDRPGFGGSLERPENAGDLGVQAAVAADVIRAEGLERPVVVGHSFGGAVALRLALDHPDLISGLVLLAPASHPWPGGVAWHYHLSANPVLGPVMNNLIIPAVGDGAAKSGIETVFSPRPVPEGYFEAARVDQALRPVTLRANATDMVGINDALAAQSRRYGEIALPVIVITGEDDDVVSTDIHARALGREIAGAEVTVLDGVGHMPQHARPDLVADAVRKLAAPAAR